MGLSIHDTQQPILSPTLSQHRSQVKITGQFARLYPSSTSPQLESGRLLNFPTSAHTSARARLPYGERPGSAQRGPTSPNAGVISSSGAGLDSTSHLGTAEIHLFSNCFKKGAFGKNYAMTWDVLSWKPEVEIVDNDTGNIDE